MYSSDLPSDNRDALEEDTGQPFLKVRQEIVSSPCHS